MASQTTKSTSCLLSPLDQLMPVTYNRIILAFTTNLDIDVDANTNDGRRAATAAIDALRQGLQTTCSQLPYLRGRVVDASCLPQEQEPKQQGGGRLAISWSEQDPTPALQEIARPADIPNSYAQLKREGLPSHRLPQSLCAVAAWVAQDFPDGTVGAPVIAVSYTCLDGGILVTLCVHHSVMDGTGTGRLISLWGRNCKAKGMGSEEVELTGPLLLPLPDAQEPQHRLERLKADGTMTPEEVGGCGRSEESDLTRRDDSDHNNSFELLLALHPEYTTVPPAAPKPPFPPCTSKIYTFPVDKLKSTATACNTSVNNVLCAIIWSCITTVRSLRRQKESTVSSASAPTPAKVKLGMAVNGRPRNGETFAARDQEQQYLGNVNLYCVTALDTNVVTAMGGGGHDALTPILHALSTSIARIDRAFISQVITLSEHAPDIRTLFPGWDFFNGPDLTITSWANLDTYAVDFGVGLGTPDFVRVPCIEGVDGLNIVLPRRRGGESAEGTVEVVVMLRRDDMADLERSGVWRDWTV